MLGAPLGLGFWPAADGSYLLAVDAASYALTLNDVTLTYFDNDGVSVDTGAHIATFGDVAFSVHRSIAFDAGSFVLTFNDVALRFNGIWFESGSFAATFGAVTLTPIISPKTASKVLYTCVLGGDYTLPISAFQARYRSGNATFLGVTVPGILAHIDAINARSSGDLVVTRTTYSASGAQLQSDDILSVTLENILYDVGTADCSGTLDGHATETFIPKTVQLEGASYSNVLDDIRRYRCAPNNALRPGDTVQINSEEFAIDLITWSVSPVRETMEIREAAA